MGELSISALRDGVEKQLDRASFLEGFTSPEIAEAVGQEIAEKIKEGFKFGVIIHRVYAPFFLETVDEILAARADLIEKNGGDDKVEFHLIERTGEVIVLLKPNPLYV